MSQQHDTTATTQPTALSRTVLVVACVLCPPLAVYLGKGTTVSVLLAVFLTVGGFHIAGVLYALYTVMPLLQQGRPAVHVDTEAPPTPTLSLSPSAPSSPSSPLLSPPPYTDVVAATASAEPRDHKVQH